MLGRAHQLGRGNAAGAHEVVDLVVALVPHSASLHPPHHVAPAIGPRHADVLTDGQRHRPAGAVDLGGELRPGGGGADHQHAALGQAVRVAVRHWSEASDGWRHGGARRRHDRHVVGATREHQGAAAPVAAGGSDPVAVVGPAHRQDRRLGLDRRVHRRRVTRHEVDHLGRAHEAVGVGAFITMARQPREPVRRQQAERVPALAAPGVRHLATFQDDVIDPELGEAPAHREPGMAGSDDDRRRCPHGAPPVRVEVAPAPAGGAGLLGWP